MKGLRLHLSIAIVLFFSISCSKPGPSDPESDVLFEENVSDWFMEGDAHWRFVNNELIGKPFASSQILIDWTLS